MTYEVIILGHLHMPLYFIGTFTEYSFLQKLKERPRLQRLGPTSATVVTVVTIKRSSGTKPGIFRQHYRTIAQYHLIVSTLRYFLGYSTNENKVLLVG